MRYENDRFIFTDATGILHLAGEVVNGTIGE